VVAITYSALLSMGSFSAMRPLCMRKTHGHKEH
jgi:hypothetical protein